MDLREFIHDLFQVCENHELPNALMAALLDDDKRSFVLDSFRKNFPDMNHDYLRDYFQGNQADRKNLMQDYTPEGLTDLTAQIAGKGERIADLCAGTGSLTIASWKDNKDAEFFCYEKSSASIPFLLFNLCLRNIKATVIHGDLLTQEVERIYQIRNGCIEILPDVEEGYFDHIVSNPPYSLKWDAGADWRFSSYSIPPKKAADYAFVLIGLSMLKPGGSMAVILPHGVLFRGNTEEEIRRQLLQDGCIRSVIGLPSKLFASTDIPVCILELCKDNPAELQVINADQLYKKAKPKNLLEPEHVERILSVWKSRKDVDKLARLVTPAEIEENNYNLNIPRYVSTAPDEPDIDGAAVMTELIQTEKEINRVEDALSAQFDALTGTNQQAAKELKRMIELWEEYRLVKKNCLI